MVTLTPASQSIQDVNNPDRKVAILSLDVNRMAVETVGDSLGLSGDLFHRHAIASFSAGETKDLISEVIATGKRITVFSIAGTGDRAGNIKSRSILINKE